MAATKNYTGRKVDLCLYPGLAASGVPVPARVGLFSRVIAGPGKAAQNFARILLTPLGTYRAYPKLGSNFMLRLEQGFVRFDVDLLHLFAGESLGVLTFMRSLATAVTPLDEQLAEVVMTSYSVQRGVVSLTLQFTTRAGVGTSFLLPVAWSS
jgi:hypothetical protein